MHHTSRVELGEILEGIVLSEALGKIYDILVGPCRSGFEMIGSVIVA
jgi:hypothetical protein